MRDIVHHRKAINNYNVKYATIEHADNVTIDARGAVKDVLGFVGDQMSESRAERRESRRESAEVQKMVTKGFLKVFGMMCIGMLIIAVIWTIIMLLT